MAEPSTKDDKREALFYGGAAAVLTVLAALPSLILATVAFWFTRGRVRRSEYLIVFVATLALFALRAASMTGTYLGWVWAALSFGDQPLWPLPFLEIANLAGFLFSTVGLLSGSKLAAKAVGKSGGLRKVLGMANSPFGDKHTIVPDEKLRNRAKIASPTGGLLAPRPTDHSVMAPDEFGKREIAVGHDQHQRPVMLSEHELGMHGLFLGSTGSGKALALDTPIPTPSGFTTMGDLRVGDELFDESGKVCRVTFATEVQHDRTCYEVRFSDGSTIVADADHRWLTDTHAGRVSAANAVRKESSRARTPGDHRDQRHKRILPAVRTTEDIRATLCAFDGRANHSIDVAASLELPWADLPIDPYVLGAWLGDGNSRNGGFTTADPEILDHIRAAGHEVTRWESCRPYGWGIANLTRHLRRLGVLTPSKKDLVVTAQRCPVPLQGKHIPDTYLRASVDQRLALLQGLVDTDGYVTETGSVEIVSTSERLALDIRHLVASLGMQPRLRPGVARLNGRETGPKWTVVFTTTQRVARLERKAARLPDTVRPTQGRRYIVDIVEAPSVPVRCIQVDSPSHLFLAGPTCIPTHNTETIKSFTAALLDLGWDGMILDLKEDTSTGGLRDFLEEYAMAHALPYQQLALSDPNPEFWFNPLAQMGPDEARDTILSLSEFDDQFWQNVNKKVLGQLVTLVYAAHEVDPAQFPYPTMYEIGKVLGSGNLPQATKAMRAVVISSQSALTTDDFSALSSPSQDEAKSAVGFGAKLTQIYETQAGRIVLRGTGNRPAIDVTSSGLTYIGLDTQGKEDMSRMVSSAVLQRMSVYAAQRTTGAMAKGKPRFLIVDEANWVHRQIVKNILSRARSAGIMLVLSTQGPDDWIDKNGDDWSVMSQNVNFGVIMAQGSPQAAELCAEWLGQHEVTSASAQFRDGQLVDSGSIRESIDYLVPPHELRRLSQGEAFFRINKPAERVGWMSIKMRDPKAQLGG